MIENGTKASTKASKGASDRLKALEISIFELRQNETDKNWQNVDKNIQVRKYAKLQEVINEIVNKRTISRDFLLIFRFY